MKTIIERKPKWLSGATRYLISNEDFGTKNITTDREIFHVKGVNSPRRHNSFIIQKEKLIELKILLRFYCTNPPQSNPPSDNNFWTEYKKRLPEDSEQYAKSMQTVESIQNVEHPTGWGPFLLLRAWP